MVYQITDESKKLKNQIKIYLTKILLSNGIIFLPNAKNISCSHYEL